MRLVLASLVALGVAIGAPRGALPSLRIGVPAEIDNVANNGDPSLTPACGAGLFPDGPGGVCVHLDRGDPNDAPLEANAHRERSGRWKIYDQIPRRPDRPENYDAYEYPIPPGLPGGHYVLSGYDLDRPDPMQRRGRTLRAVGHGGVDLPQARGTDIVMIALESQQGDADVVYAGPLFGTTVVTRHTVKEAGTVRDYLLLFGHMESIAPGAIKGAKLRPGDAVGKVGDTGSPELVHLHLEARRVRQGADVFKLTPNDLLADHVSVVCDPRNVLRLKPH